MKWYEIKGLFNLWWKGLAYFFLIGLVLALLNQILNGGRPICIFGTESFESLP